MEKLISTYSTHLQSEAVRKSVHVSEFWNYGYWLPETRNPRQASLELMNYLIGKLPRNSKRILDVGFGKGASTKRLCELFGVSRVIGLNIAPDQVEFARRNGVLCQLKVMDAVDLDFGEGTVDGILCMEAAFHFRSRRGFLEKAYSVLAPGGHLVMSDILFRSGYGLDPEVFPPENWITSLSQYEQLFVDAGFQRDLLLIEPTSTRQIIPHIAYLARAAGFLAPDTIRIDTPYDRSQAVFIVTRLLNVLECVIVAAVKPKHAGME